MSMSTNELSQGALARKVIQLASKRQIIFLRFSLLLVGFFSASCAFGQRETARAAIGERLLPTCMAIFSDKDTVVIGAGRPNKEDKDGIEYVQVWSLGKVQRIWAPIGQRTLVVCVATSPDSMLFAAAGEDETVSLWDLNGRKAIAQLFGHQGRVRALAFYPGKLPQIASASDDNSIRIWDYTTRKEIGRSQPPTP